MKENGQGRQEEEIKTTRVSQAEYYPQVGSSAKQLIALVPIFGAEIVSALSKGIENGGLSTATLILESSGDSPQKLSVFLTGANSGNRLTMELGGDWEGKEKIPEGTPLVASYDGKFSRRVRPEDPNPIAKEQDLILPGGTIGWAFSGKNRSWAYQLPKTFFPKGAQITHFATDSEMGVEKGTTVICHVKAIQ